MGDRSTMLPSSRALPRVDWERRHRWICLLVWLHAAGTPVAALAVGGGWTHALGHGLPVALCAVVAGSSRLAGVRLRSVVAAAGVLASAASVVHLSGGATEAHFHFFVALVLLALYEDWLVLGLAIVFVPAHHIGLGLVDEAAVFDHDGTGTLLGWSLLHTGYLTAAVVATVVAWRLNQDIRERAHFSEQQFRGAFGNAPIGMALVDLDGRFLEVNEALCRVLGRSGEELLAGDFQRITHPEDLGSDLDLLHQVLRGERDAYTMEKRYVHADGHAVWASLHVSLVRHDDGSPRHFISQIVDVTQRREADDRLRYLADHDELTGLFGRRRFLHELERHAALADRHSQQGSLLLIDLDDFKAVNDGLGHDAGDELLRCVAATLRDRMRRSDIVARLGGDEFAVLLPQTLPQEAAHVAASLRDAIGAIRMMHRGRAVGTAASIGVAPITGQDARTLLSAADIAMYRAKNAGRNRVRVISDRDLEVRAQRSVPAHSAP